MLKIASHVIQEIQNAEQASDLYKHLQAAIELEHSTIPLYLTALYSIQPNSNEAVAEIILSVVREEMLHMVIAANVLNAIGGSPQVNKPEFIPTYPGHLPMVQPDLIVGLAPLSSNLITNTFMQIETSVDPEDYPAKPVAFAQRTLSEEEYKTIGEFYEAIIQKITELSPGLTQLAQSAGGQTGQTHLNMICASRHSDRQAIAIRQFKLDQTYMNVWTF